MRDTKILPGLLLASGLAVLGLGPISAVAAPGAGRAQGVTHRVGTRETSRRATPAPRDGDPAAPRFRPGAPAASGRESIEQTPKMRKVFGHDDRFPVGDPTAYPWSAICKVTVEFPDGTRAEGSAVLVGDRFALTAGHVVHDADHGGFADRVTVVPAADGPDAPFGVFEAEGVTSFAGWTDDGDFDYDFALLRLDGAPGDATGWLGLGAYSDAYLTGVTVNTAGYPSDLDDGEFMFTATGTVDRVTPGQLLVRGGMDAADGQSGSGVWVLRDDGRYVAGVVSTETSTHNRAARITGTVFDALASWMDEADAADFAVTGLAAPLPAEFEAPHVATATVTVANGGMASDWVQVAALARDARGRRTVLARRTVFVGAGDDIVTTLPLSFGTGFRAGAWVLEAEVNRDRAVVESDYGNDRRSGPAFVVLPPYRALDAGRTGNIRLDAGGIVRYRLAVPDALRAARFELDGPRGTFATLTRPDGTRLSVAAGRRKTILLPPGGAWLVDVRTPSRLRRLGAVRFRAVPRR